MKHTHKFIIAAVAVIFACMPVIVEARHTEDTYYNKYSEGQTLGSLSYSDITLPVLYGIEQSTVDTGNIECFGLSAPDHLIMLSHSDAGFSKLYDYSEVGAKINVVLNNDSVWYEIINAYWLDQITWESEQFMYDFYYNDNTPLTLITCNHRNGVRGRWIVQCTYSNEPEQAAIVEDVVYLPAETETVEEVEISEIIEEENEVCEIEETEILETMKETPVASITPLNLLKMKKIYVADYIRLYRGL